MEEQGQVIKAIMNGEWPMVNFFLPSCFRGLPSSNGLPAADCLLPTAYSIHSGTRSSHRRRMTV